MVEGPLTKMKVQMAKTKLRSPDQPYSAHTRVYLVETFMSTHPC